MDREHPITLENAILRLYIVVYYGHRHRGSDSMDFGEEIKYRESGAKSTGGVIVSLLGAVIASVCILCRCDVPLRGVVHIAFLHEAPK